MRSVGNLVRQFGVSVCGLRLSRKIDGGHESGAGQTESITPSCTQDCKHGELCAHACSKRSVPGIECRSL